MRARLYLGSIFTLVFGAGAVIIGCAESDTINTGGFNQSSSSSGSGGEGGGSGAGGTGGTGASGSSSSTTGSSSSSSSSGAGGSGTGGEGGTGGGSGGGGMSSSSSSSGMVDPCMNGCPTNTYDIDGNPLTGQCGCEYSCTPTGASDPVDDQYKDDNCDGADYVVESCIYVSTSVGSDVNNGSRTDPMQTISGAIQRAQMKGVPAVCLSGEIYNEAVNVASGISVYGGFDQNDADFKFRRSPNVTTTVKASGTVFYAAQVDQDTHIEGITIEAASAMGNGESTYGVRLGGGIATLYVRYNKMTVGNGKDGTKGNNGLAHAQGTAPGGNNGTKGAQKNTNSGFGGSAPICDAPGGKGGDGGADAAAGQNGAAGAGGTPGGAGAGSNACTPAVGSPGTPGGPGNQGNQSAQGASGQGGASLGGVMTHFYLPAAGTDGGTALIAQAGGGGGGGGGGRGDGFCFGDWDKGGGGGSGGCGGKGGNGGFGGQGGGGSFGVFAASGKVIMSNNDIQLGAGGNGGLGGNGAAGQLGGVGGTGGGNNDDSGAGGKGGDGAKGGAGGPGGGGGGGPSACLARSSGVTFTFTANSCSTGAVGLGANGGTNPDGGTGNKGNNGTSGFNIQMN